MLDRDVVMGRLSAAARADLARQAVSRWVPLGGALWRAGEPSHEFMFVMSGVAAVTAVGRSGRSVAIEYGGVGDCVDMAGTLHLDRRETTAFALTRHVAYCAVPREAVVAEITAHPSAGLSLACAIAAQIAASHVVLQGLAVEVETRMARVVHAMSLRFGVEQTNGAITLPMPFPRGDMARLVGTSAETVIRIFSRWRSLGYIRGSPSGIDVLDATSIQQIASLETPIGQRSTPRDG